MESDQNQEGDLISMIGVMTEKGAELIRSCLIEIKQSEFKRIMDFEDEDLQYSFFMKSLNENLVQWVKSLIRSRSNQLDSEDQLREFCGNLEVRNERLITGSSEV